MDNTRRRVMRRALLVVVVVAALLPGCETRPTPFPVDLPATPTPTPPPEALPPLRYAVTAEVGDRIPELALLRSTGEVVVVDLATAPDGLGTIYDLIVRYGQHEGWTPTPLTPRVALVINTSRPPFDNPELAALLASSLDPAAVVPALGIPGAQAVPHAPVDVNTIRTRLANSGLPDGIAFVLAETFVPGAPLLAAQMQAANFAALPASLTPAQTREALDSGRVQAALVMWAAEAERAGWAARFGAEAVTDLYTTPLSYRALESLTIAFTPAGWPLPGR